MLAERLLRWLLVLTGATCMAGGVAVYMPRQWMVVAHEWLGMGKFPDQAIAEYLARLTAALYAMYGLLLIVMATDVRRHARIITVQAFALVAVAASADFMLWGTDIPAWWILGDVGSCIAFAAATLALQGTIGAAQAQKGE